MTPTEIALCVVGLWALAGVALYFVRKNWQLDNPPDDYPEVTDYFRNDWLRRKSDRETLLGTWKQS